MFALSSPLSLAVSTSQELLITQLGITTIGAMPNELSTVGLPSQAEGSLDRNQLDNDRNVPKLFGSRRVAPTGRQGYFGTFAGVKDSWSRDRRFLGTNSASRTSPRPFEQCRHERKDDSHEYPAENQECPKQFKNRQTERTPKEAAKCNAERRYRRVFVAHWI